MEVEKIFRSIPVLKNISLDRILFESKYPVMFTCKNGRDVYLFICCLVNSKIIKWIGTKTDYELLLRLLKNEVTIRNAFLGVTNEKLIIEYDGRNATLKTVLCNEIQDALLPTAGEYLDAEEDEYEEEIAVFKARMKTEEYSIQSRLNYLCLLNYSERRVTLTDEYFEKNLGTMNEMRINFRSMQRQSVVFV